MESGRMENRGQGRGKKMEGVKKRQKEREKKTEKRKRSARKQEKVCSHSVNSMFSKLDGRAGKWGRGERSCPASKKILTIKKKEETSRRLNILEIKNDLLTRTNVIMLHIR